MGFPCGSAGKKSACNVGDLGLIPPLGRSPGEGKGYPPQYSGLENSLDFIVHGVAKSWTWLSSFHFPQFMGSFGVLIHYCIIFSKIFILYWSAVDLQCCVSFWCTAKLFSYICSHPFFFRFFPHIGYYRVLSRVPCAIQQVLVSDLFYIWWFSC